MFKQCDPAQSLTSAISIIDQFALRNGSGLKMQKGHLKMVRKKWLRQFLDFIWACFSYRKRKKLQLQKKQVQETVLQAIEYVKSHYLLIHQFQYGNAEEKKLASHALDTIKRYNAVIAKKKNADAFFTTALGKVFYQRIIDDEWNSTHIDMPHVYQAYEKSKFQDVKIASTFLSQMIHAQSEPVNKQEADAIRMKANTLIQSHGISFKSAQEAFNSLKTAPIHAVVDTHSHTSTLCLTLDVLPGTKVKIRGSFKRDPSSKQFSLPISNSFELFLQSTQPGFPHPLQRGGYSFDTVLIPDNPHRLDCLPHFSELYRKKQHVDQGLSKEGHLIEQTQKLVR